MCTDCAMCIDCAMCTLTDYLFVQCAGGIATESETNEDVKPMNSLKGQKGCYDSNQFHYHIH